MLRRAVDSALCQTEQDFELIVVDDGSTDGTHQYLAALAAADARVRPIYNRQCGGGAVARNLGIAASKGRWIAFLDDDDEWLPGKLRLQIAALQATPAAVACSSWYLRRRVSGATELVRVPPTASFEDLLQGSVMGGASMCMCDAQTVKRIGGYDPTLRSGQDWDLWTRLSQVGAIISCAESTVLYSWHDGPRITNDMYAQYQGARRFYFKYKQSMTVGMRQHRLAYLCYIMSRQPKRSLGHRFHYLRVAVCRAEPGIALKYMASSLPRLIRAIFPAYPKK
jgi:glycosyltransferase involved in cell wall biosynthesis